jgi:hypothetical protein
LPFFLREREYDDEEEESLLDVDDSEVGSCRCRRRRLDVDSLFIDRCFLSLLRRFKCSSLSRLLLQLLRR